MRLELREDGVVLVTLSRRNVLSLLSKLEQKNSARTIVMRGAYVYGVLHEDLFLAVQVEPDELHYAGREPPGEMSPETERFVEARTPGNGTPSNEEEGDA